MFRLLFVWLQICVAIAGYLLTAHSFRAYFYLLCFFAPFFNDSFTVPQCAAAAGGPEHVLYYHFCGSFTVCAKVCVRVRSSVCVCALKGIKSFGHFAARYLFQFVFVCVEFLLPPLLPLLLLNLFRLFLLFHPSYLLAFLTFNQEPETQSS